MSFSTTTDGISKLEIHENPGSEIRRLCVGGVTHLPSHLRRIAERLPGTTIIADNPFQDSRGTFNELSGQLRGECERLFVSQKCDSWIGTSLGSWHLLSRSQKLSDLKRCIAIAPTLNAAPEFGNEYRLYTTEEQRKASSDMAFFDRRMNSILPKEMDPEKYKSILEELLSEIGRRREKRRANLWLPAKGECLRNAVNELIYDTTRLTQVSILMLVDLKDPWVSEIPEAIRTSPHIEVVEVPGSHYPHLVDPEETAKAIMEFETQTS